MKILIIHFSILLYSLSLFASELRRGEPAYTFAPQNLGNLISEHVNHMEAGGFFEEISDTDFYHGHLITNGVAEGSINLEDLRGKVTGILYHTAEHNGRWHEEGNEGLDVEDRNPRSLFGSVDGALWPAVHMIDFGVLKPNRFSSYAKSGTVFTEDLVTIYPNLSDRSYSFGRPSHPILINWDFTDRFQKIYMGDQFLLKRKEGGEFKTDSGTSYNILLALRDIEMSVQYVGGQRLPVYIEPGKSKFPWR